MEVDLTGVPDLTPEQQALLQAHSLWNGYNVMRDQSVTLGHQLAGRPDLLATGISACEKRIERLRDTATTMEDAAQLDELDITIDTEIDKHTCRIGSGCEPVVESARTNLRLVAWILRVRARELMARAISPRSGFAWTAWPAADLHADFREFLDAVEQTSHRRCRLVSNLAIQEPVDTCVDLQFESARGSTLLLPAIFKDVMRDLIANARKYTAPGGQIRAAAHWGPDGLRFVVQDNGRGIPAAELGEVVKPGYRATNVRDLRTMGGGFGLTKACWVTRQLHGRMWIESEESRGTRIRIWLPAPVNGRASSSFSE
jgi:signal transduction histidine kinase